MKVYDISQEILTCEVYPGDPQPQRKILQNMSAGSLYNLSSFQMCTHNGTHVDAPSHFIKDGKTIDKIAIEAFVGMAYVAEHDGVVSAHDASAIMQKAQSADPEAAQRILIKGNAEVSLEAAEIFAHAGLLLLGNESQSVGPINAPMAVHKTLLSREIVLLEGIRLSGVPEGVYLLHAAPLYIAGAEGSPCRATLTAL